jgi:hypothetical protein
MTPVELFKEVPVGSAPEVRVKVYGPVPPIPEMVSEYAIPTVPLWRTCAIGFG